MYLSLFGHIDPTVLDMHDTASPVILKTCNHSSLFVHKQFHENIAVDNT